MKVERPSPDALRFAELDPFLFELLKLMPSIADDTAEPAVRDRLFPDPSDEDEANAEWHSLTGPELQALFDTANQTVRHDLADAGGDADAGYSVTLPLDHAEAWLNCLNRARLALAAAHDIGERDMACEIRADIRSSRELAVFQVQFFGILQECILHEIDAPPDGGGPGG